MSCKPLFALDVLIEFSKYKFFISLSGFLFVAKQIKLLKTMFTGSI